MTEELWTIRRMLEWMEGYLGAHGDANPRLSAQLLVSHATELSRVNLFLEMDRPLDGSELDWLREAVKRRSTGEPIQYITGFSPFRFLELKTSPDVLIPRPETEVLVSEVLAFLPKNEAAHALDSKINEYGELLYDAGDGLSNTEKLKVVDLCTGSGCIACSIASENSLCEVWATDISDAALVLAEQNVSMIGLGERVHILKSNLGDEIDPDLLGSIDVVVSNPPYIPTAILHNLPNEVKDFEPKLALDGGEDGLDFFRRIAQWSKKALKPGGLLACELHEDSLDDAAKILSDLDFIQIKITSDLASKPRVISAIAPSEV